MEDQGFVQTVFEVDNPADDDHVIAARVAVLGLALVAPGKLGEYRVPFDAGAALETLEFVAGARREAGR